jgi:predicted phage baseplate assembly protein
VLERVCTNTMWARHQTTIDDEELGSSTGKRSQVFRAAHAPVLEGQVLEVREQDAGPWLRWEAVIDFHDSGPEARHYVLDRASGAITFGDGLRGRIPPRGRENIRWATYRTGGGAAGNRAAGTISRLLSTLPYIDGVTNLAPSSGGVAAEAPGAFIERGPRTLRHRDRAVVGSDFEDLAREASLSIARASVVSEPGRVGVVVVPSGDEEQPLPTAEQIERVEQYVRDRAPATYDLWVAGPGWVRVDVVAEIVPVALELASDVDSAVRARLRAFLHPLTGKSGAGWGLGQRVYRSDVRAVIEGVAGVDHTGTLTLRETITAPSPAEGSFLVYSGEHDIRVVGSDRR